MITDVFMKLLNKLIEKATTPEDLILMILLFGLGILATPLWKKYSNKPPTSEQKEELCPITGKKMKCEEIPKVLQELKQLQIHLHDAKLRITKIMNVVSKEYEGQWDRYLYDTNIDPDEDENNPVVRDKRKRK